MNYKFVILLTLGIGFSNFICAQEYEFRGYVGANYYQGDLSPRNSRWSFSEGKLAYSFLFGVKINNTFRLNSKLMIGQLVGSDADAVASSRKLRNLSFSTPIYEIGINTEISINNMIKSLNKYGVEWYITSGINLLHFVPKTVFQGKVVELQPLGTEGQGLPGFADYYSLYQITLPSGIGAKFRLSDRLNMGLEVAPRFTFTDYLDDVSGSYISYDELLAAGRPLSAALSNRQGELTGMNADIITGTLRGNPEGNDWYFFASIHLNYQFGDDVDQRIQEKILERERKKKDAQGIIGTTN